MTVASARRLAAARHAEYDVDRRTPRVSEGEVVLRDVTENDLDILFEQQRDPAANRMAAFTAKDPADREAFAEHWARILGDDAIVKKTVVHERRVVGHVLSFERFGKPEVSYWIGRRYWGRGLATRALSGLLVDLKERPLYARVAKDNVASLRVLEKCGFTIFDEGRAFSNARGEDVEEFILVLDPKENEPPRRS